MKHLSLLISLFLLNPVVFGQYDTILVSGTERSYLMHVPDNLPVGEKVPLVIALHLLGSNSASFESLTGFSIKAEQEGFIVAYPQGIGNSWNAGGCCDPAMTGDVDDVGFISALIDTLIQDCQVDTSKVFVAGFSNGGIMCYRLASEISDKLAGVAAVGALFLMNDNLATKPVPIIHFHALDDYAVNFNGNFNSTLYKSVPQLLDEWKTINGITALPDTFRKEDGITGILYSSEDSTANIILYTSQTGGHNWTINNRLGTTNKIWEFFENQINKVDKVYDTIVEGPRQRDYKIHIPSSYFTNVDQTKKYPLVIAAHGWYGYPDDMESKTGFSAKADAKNFFVSYLHYVGPPPDLSWNYFMDIAKPDDIGYANAVIDTMFARYPIDSSNVFIIGFSDGCGMANRLPFESKIKINAIGTVGGMVTFSDDVETKPVRMIHFHARYDPAVNYSNVRNSSLNYWLDVNSCNEEPDTLINEQGYVGERWKNTDDSTMIIFYTLPWNVHGWPMDQLKLTATDLIWEFFTTGIAIPDIAPSAINESPAERNSVNYYPNPSFNEVYVTLQLEKPGKIYLDILNINGQAVTTKEIGYLLQGKTQFSIDVNDLAKGYYMFRIRSNNYSTVNQIIIN
jgi:polyhydroxybutyrate depolymerase